MINTYETRFGALDIDDAKAIHFPSGMIGFPEEKLFALINGRDGSAISYLQSLRTPALAFPIIDGSTFGPAYPAPDVHELAASAGLATDELAVAVVVAARASSPRLIANALAPVIIDARGRRGVQIVLDPASYSAEMPLTTAQLDLTTRTSASAAPRTPVHATASAELQTPAR